MRKKIISPRMIVAYVVLIFFAFLTLYPFLWMLAASFKPLSEIIGGNLQLISSGMTLDNYKSLIGRSSLFFHWFINSVFVSTIGTTVNIFFNTMAGYALARLHFPGRKTIYFAILGVMMVPGQVLMIPNYLIIQQFGLLDSFGALIVPAAVNIGNIFMMRQFFINFPSDVEEAASIDGLGRYSRFFRICMPLAQAAIATQAVFVFMGFWNEFIRSMLYMKTPLKYTLTLGLQTFQSQNAGRLWNEIMAASTITLIPIIIIYFIFNQYFLRGVRMDGEK